MGDVVPLPLRPRNPDRAPQGEPLSRPEKREGEPVRRSLDPTRVEPLWRESAGRELRRERLATGRRLVDVAEEAGVSPQYLSEVERGLKDPSSELLSAMAGALGLTVAEIATRVAARSFSPRTPLALAA